MQARIQTKKSLACSGMTRSRAVSLKASARIRQLVPRAVEPSTRRQREASHTSLQRSPMQINDRTWRAEHGVACMRFKGSPKFMDPPVQQELQPIVQMIRLLRHALAVRQERHHGSGWC
jgi:hypothetical protein